MIRTYILALFLFTLSVTAQQHGKITYTEEWKRDFRNWSYTETHTWELIFNDSIAICRWIKPKEEEKSAGAVQVYRWQMDINDLYVSYFAEKRIEDVQDFMRKTFIIKDNFPDIRWKMTGKQGLVESHPCMEAMYRDGDDTIYAWFSPRIPVSIGPREYRGLPGIILYMEADGGKRKITIEDVDLKYVPSEEELQYKLPKGQKSSYADFAKMRREKSEEMKEMYGR